VCKNTILLQAWYILANIELQLFKGRLCNLVDVLDAYRRGKGEIAPIFANMTALEEHTKRLAAYFPRYHETSGGLLKRVLRKAP
jgi:hypothetical protein